MISEISGIDSSYEIPDELRNQIFPLLVHKPKRKKNTGRPRMDDRKAMNAIFYIARTGCQWKALPRSLGASSTVHDRFQEWRQDGVFKRMWIDGLKIYDKRFPTEIRNSAAGFVYNGGLLVGSWAPLIVITLFSYFDKYNITQYYAIAIIVVIVFYYTYNRF